MEKFLLDYGLKWVGENNTQEGEFLVDDVKKELGCAMPLYKNNLPREIDMNVVARRIDELNITMGFSSFLANFLNSFIFIIKKKTAHMKCSKTRMAPTKSRNWTPLSLGSTKTGLSYKGSRFTLIHPEKPKFLCVENTIINRCW